MITKQMLVIQNKGGGHGELGYQICQAVLADKSKDIEITMVQDDAANMHKLPFSCYAEDLEAKGVKVVMASLDAKALGAADVGSKGFDYVVDNWSKSPEDFKFVQGLLAKPDALEQYVFISSAGMYVTGSGVHPHVETDDVKESNGPRTVEVAAMEAGIPYTFMRPQYIYGPKMAKRYLDFYIGRAMRNLPIPLPMSGEQLVALTHSEDIGSLVCAAVGHPAAMNEIFNCGTDEYQGYEALADMFNEACGTKPQDFKYMYFDPKDFDAWDKSDPVFPFRRETFVTSVDKAKKLLGWAPKYRFKDEVPWLVQDYKDMGGMKKTWDEQALKCDLEILASKDHNMMFTYAFFDDKSINPESAPYAFEGSSGRADNEI